MGEKHVSLLSALQKKIFSVCNFLTRNVVIFLILKFLVRFWNTLLPHTSSYEISLVLFSGTPDSFSLQADLPSGLEESSQKKGIALSNKRSKRWHSLKLMFPIKFDILCYLCSLRIGYFRTFSVWPFSTFFDSFCWKTGMHHEEKASMCYITLISKKFCIE